MLENLPSSDVIAIIIAIAAVLTIVLERVFPRLLKSFGYERVKGAFTTVENVLNVAERMLPDGTLPDLLSRLAGTAVHAAEQLFDASQGPQKYDYAARFMREGLKASGVDNPDKYDSLIRGSIEATVLLMSPAFKKSPKPVPEPAPAVRADDATQR
jgi:hypothetical protein